MTDILAALPGDSVKDVCARAGFSRNAYYAWYRGERRPDSRMALKLAKLTGYTLEEILGNGAEETGPRLARGSENAPTLPGGSGGRDGE